MRAEEVEGLLAHLSAAEREELDRLLAADTEPWRPQPGPQSQAFHSTAHVLGYGGAAGGGKTDLACGKALTQHTRSMILRRSGVQLTGIVDRLAELLGGRAGYNGADHIWRLEQGRQIEFGAVPNLGDETKYQGRPHDFLAFDEATNFLESQVRFLLGWLRTTVHGQRCQALLAFNPPVTAEGRWVTAYFAPWLDDMHPNPAAPGELRWFAMIDGEETEIASGKTFRHKGELIRPLSRTFIPSRVSDNPYLTGTGYMATLQALPEPLRAQMLRGDFSAGVQDDAWQIIPTAWVDAAQARWEPKAAKGVMESMGVDVARGGRDETIIARRHGVWFDQMLARAGTDTPDGPTVAAQIITERRDQAPVHIDIVGWGSSPYDFLVQNGVQTEGVNSAEKALGKTRDNTLAFANRRAELWWRMREELDPLNPNPIALPPDPKLRADLCAPRWKLTAAGIQVEAKEDIIKRIGRSPDRGDAVCLAAIATGKRGAVKAKKRWAVGGWMG